MGFISLSVTVLLLGLVSGSLACLAGGRTPKTRGQQSSTADHPLANVDSASIDIPVHLQVQRGPVPSASLTIGVDSRINQRVGDGYRQQQQTGNFEFGAVGVPVLDAQRRVQGLSADIDFHMDRGQKVNYFTNNPSVVQARSDVQLPAGAAPPALPSPIQPLAAPITAEQMAQLAALSAAQLAERMDSKTTDKPAVVDAGFRLEHLIAVVIAGGICLLALIGVLIVLLMRLKRQAQPIGGEVRRRHHGHVHSHLQRISVPAIGADSVYSAPIFVNKASSTIVGVDSVNSERPPAYGKDEVMSAKF